MHYDFEIFKPSTNDAKAANVAKPEVDSLRKTSKTDSRDHTQGSMSLGPISLSMKNSIIHVMKVGLYPK